MLLCQPDSFEAYLCVIFFSFFLSFSLFLVFLPSFFHFFLLFFFLFFFLIILHLDRRSSPESPFFARNSIAHLDHHIRACRRDHQHTRLLNTSRSFAYLPSTGSAHVPISESRYPSRAPSPDRARAQPRRDETRRSGRDDGRLISGAEGGVWQLQAPRIRPAL